MLSGKAIVLLVVPVLLTTLTGHAESLSAKERNARTACLAGDYAKGVQLLSELFVATMDPTFIFNQGRCFEQNRRYEDAIARFQEYLRAAKKAAKANRAEAQKHIDDCEELLAKEKAQTVPPPQAAPAPSQMPPQTISPTPMILAPIVPAQPSPESPSSSAGAGLRTAGIVAASIGGASLIAGISFNLKSNSLANDLKKPDGYSPGKESDRETYRSLGWVGYGTGAALVATGAVLYLLGLQSGGSPGHKAVAFTAVLASGEVAAGMRGAF